jgi:thiamine-phosphate pyrophosphorylase
VRALKGLYPIVNVAQDDARSLEPYVRTLADVGVVLVQLRAKHANHEQRLRLVESCLGWLQGTETELVVNDDALAAATCGAPWVHVGQGDLGLSEVRRRYPRLRIGISTHTLAQLDAALRERPGYVAYGPVHDTRSKVDADPVVGVAGLREAHRRTQGTPLIAIGGLALDNVAEVAAHASMGAVISALEQAADLRAMATLLHQRLGG